MSQILPGENGSVSFVAMTSDANKQNFTIRVEYSRTELQEFIEKGNSSTQLAKLSCKEFSEKRMDLGGESCIIGEEVHCRGWIPGGDDGAFSGREL